MNTIRDWSRSTKRWNSSWNRVDSEREHSWNCWRGRRNTGNKLRSWSLSMKESLRKIWGWDSQWRTLLLTLMISGSLSWLIKEVWRSRNLTFRAYSYKGKPFPARRRGRTDRKRIRMNRRATMERTHKRGESRWTAKRRRKSSSSRKKISNWKCLTGPKNEKNLCSL